MKRQVWADEEVATSVNAQFIPVAIDLDNPDDAALLARYNVGSAPVTIITDPQGNALGKPEFNPMFEKPKRQFSIR